GQHVPRQFQAVRDSCRRARSSCRPKPTHRACLTDPSNRQSPDWTRAVWRLSGCFSTLRLSWPACPDLSRASTRAATNITKKVNNFMRLALKSRLFYRRRSVTMRKHGHEGQDRRSAPETAPTARDLRSELFIAEKWNTMYNISKLA